MPPVSNRLSHVAVTILCVASLLSACSSPTASDPTPRIVVTTNFLGALAGELLGDEVPVTVLDQPGQDPHAEEAHPVEITGSTVLAVVTNGGGLDDRWERVIEELTPKIAEPFVAMDVVPGALDLVFAPESDGAIAVANEPAQTPKGVERTTTSTRFETTTTSGMDGGSAKGQTTLQPDPVTSTTAVSNATAASAFETTTSTGSSGDSGRIEAVVDPHFWVDPQKVAAVVPALAQFLAEASPENGEAIMKRSANLVSRLAAEASDWEQRFAVIPPPRRKLITDHPSLGYLSAYGLTTAGVVEVDLGAEQAAQQADAVSVLMEAQQLCAILVTDPEQLSAAQRVAGLVGPNVIVQEVPIRQPEGDLIEFYRTIADSIVTGLTTCGVTASHE